jgi:hypothetical protein
MMKTPILLSILCAGIAGGCATRRPTPIQPAARENLIGAWRLISWEARVEGQTSFPFGSEAGGLLIYAATGQMSVFLSQSKREHFTRAEAKAGTPTEKAAAFDSCFAYSGTFRVADGRVTHRLDHCTFPNWIGTEQVRFLQIDGDRLILETPPLPMNGTEAVSRLIWERIKP